MKKVLTYILIFILIILYIVTIALNTLKFTILSPNYIIQSLEKNNYYLRTDTNIKEGFRDYILQSGLEEDVLEGLYSFDQLKVDINGVINSLYTDKEYTLHTDEIRKNLQNKIDAILEENGRKLSSREKTDVDRFINSICNAYNVEVEYSKTAVSSISNVLSKVLKYINIINILLIVTTVLVVGIILLMRKSVNVAQAFAIALVSAGLILLVIYFFISSNIAINNLLIVSVLFSEMISYLLNSILNIFMIMGIINIIVGIIFACFSAKKSKPY